MPGRRLPLNHLTHVSSRLPIPSKDCYAISPDTPSLSGKTHISCPTAVSFSKHSGKSLDTRLSLLRPSPYPPDSYIMATNVGAQDLMIPATSFDRACSYTSESPFPLPLLSVFYHERYHHLPRLTTRRHHTLIQSTGPNPSTLMTLESSAIPRLPRPAFHRYVQSSNYPDATSVRKPSLLLSYRIPT